MSAIGIVLHSISLIIAGRVIDGFTAGSLSTAQAAIVDLSSEETKTKNIGYILFALSMGFMVGPLIGGFLSDPQWSSWFGLTTPLYFAGLLSFLNIILLQFGFKETFVPKMKKGISLISGFTVFRSAFSNSVIFRLTMAFLFLQLGWSTYVQFIGLFLTLEYHFNPHQVGVFMAFIGLGFTLAFCYLLNVLTHHFSLRMIALSTTGIMSASMLAVVLIKSEISAWILSVPAATCLALAYSVLVSLFSNAVDKEKQGWVMGLTGAIGALSFGLTGILAGVIVDYGTNIPIWIACICLGASCFSILFVPQKR
jgi:MFS family permease